MGRTGHGKNRYPHRAPAALADTGLGPAIMTSLELRVLLIGLSLEGRSDD